MRPLPLLGGRQGGNGIVALDAIGTSAANNSATSENYTGITVGTGAQRALVCAITFSLAVTGLTLTWGSQAMTLIISRADSNGMTAQLWGLVAPASGNQTLAISWTGSANFQMDCASFTGVNQAGGLTTFFNANSAAGNSASPTVTCSGIAAHDAAMDSIEVQQALASPTQTNIYTGAGGAVNNGGSSYALGSGGTVTFGWTSGGGVTAAPWASVCVGIAHS